MVWNEIKYRDVQLFILILFPYGFLLQGGMDVDIYKVLVLILIFWFTAFFLIGGMKVHVLWSPGATWLLLFTLAYIISTAINFIGNENPYNLLKGLGYYIIYPVLLVTIFYWVGFDNRRLNLIVSHFCYAAVLLATTVIVLCLFWNGGTTMRNIAGQKELWLFGDTLLGNPNSSARFLVSVLPLIFWKVINTRKIIWHIGIIVVVIALFLTTSKTGIVLTIFALVWLGYQYRGNARIRKVVMVSIIVALAGMLYATGYIAHKFESYSEQYRLNGYYSLRMPIWISAIEIIEENPILGVGAGNAQNELGNDTGLMNLLEKAQGRERNAIDTHNVYIKILMEGGILTFIPFMGYLLFIGIYMLQKKSFPYKGGMIPLFVLMFGGMFADVFNEGWLWALIGIFLSNAVLTSRLSNNELDSCRVYS